MLYIIYSILLITVLALQFKIHPRYEVSTFQSIVINYVVCLILAYILTDNPPQIGSMVKTEWFPYTILLGFLFIVGFNVLAITIDAIGMTMASVFQKISMIIPVLLAIIIFGETTGWIKITGLLIACMAIIMTYDFGQKEKTKTEHPSAKVFLWPMLTFLIGGLIDYVFFYVKKVDLVDDDMLFCGVAFGMAAFFGLIIWGYLLLKQKQKPNLRSVLAGILLGIPNVFSLYYVLRSLDVGIEGSIVFPLINIGVILSSTIAGVVLFREQLSSNKRIAIGLAVLSILIISYQA